MNNRERFLAGEPFRVFGPDQYQYSLSTVSKNGLIRKNISSICLDMEFYCNVHNIWDNGFEFLFVAFNKFIIHETIQFDSLNFEEGGADK